MVVLLDCLSWCHFCPASLPPEPGGLKIGKKSPNFWKKVAKTVIYPKSAIKARFESLKQTTFVTLKYLQQTIHVLRWSCKKIARAKSSPKCRHLLGLLLLLWSHIGHPKVAKVSKNRPIWSPCPWMTSFFVYIRNRQPFSLQTLVKTYIISPLGWPHKQFTAVIFSDIKLPWSNALCMHTIFLWYSRKLQS